MEVTVAETPSHMVPLGTKAPDFRLLDTVSGKYVTLQDLKSDKATVIMFICNHCPYVKHIQEKMTEIARLYQGKGINFAAISSNDVADYPTDGPDRMRAEAIKHQYSFPYLYDETQDVAKAYQAACTPDFYVFDKDSLCVYRGRFDSSTPGNQLPVTGHELQHALDNILANQPVGPDQKASIGCNIKWKRK
jgi:thiol-disulfide isomerase/thioredoxin